MDDYVQITDVPIAVEDIVSRLTRPEIGAVATFVGVVRGAEDREQISHLEYEAYQEMAIKEMRRICVEVKDRWNTIHQVVIVHRVGRLKVGETAVVIGVAAPHRSEVFDALRYAIDRLKKIVPIWKKEVGKKGERWKSEN